MTDHSHVNVQHRDLFGDQLHVPGYVQPGDPGPVGGARLWIDTSLGVGHYRVYVRAYDNLSWLLVSDDPASYLSNVLLGPLSNGDLLQYDTVLGKWKNVATIDHGTSLTGLLDDDHTQYALLAGRAGGQVLTGGTGSGDDLTLISTSHGTKGSIFIGSTIIEVNQALSTVGIGGAADSDTLLTLVKTTTIDGSSPNYGMKLTETLSLTADEAANQYGARIELVVNNNTFAATKVNTALMFIASLTGSNAAGTSGVMGIYGGARHTGSGSIASLIDFYSDVTVNSGGGSVANAYGMYIGNKGATGVTNSYGIYIHTQSGSSSLNSAITTWGGDVVFNDSGSSTAIFRVEGDTDPYLIYVKPSTDQVGIGTNAPTTGYKLDVAGFIYSVQTVNQNTYPSINAQQISSTLQSGTAYTGTDATMSTQYVAFKVTASGNHTMGQFVVKVKAVGTITNVTNTITGHIYADDGGSPSKPTGAALATGAAVRFGTLTAAYQNLSLGTIYNLVSGTSYWLVIRWSSTPAGGGTIVFDSDTSTNMGATSTDGSTWTNTNVRLYHYIRGLTGYGVYGISSTRAGVYGISSDSYGVYGSSTNSCGVTGISVNFFGMYGSSVQSYGVYGVSTNGYGVGGFSTTQIGVYGASTSYIGVYGISTSSIPALFQANPTSTNTTVDILRLVRNTSGTAANGIGGYIAMYAEDDGGTDELTARIGYLLTNAGAATEVSALTFSVRTGGAAVAEVMRLQGDTGLILNEGGDPAFDVRIESDSYDALFIDSSNNSIAMMNNASGKISFFGATPATKTAVADLAGATAGVAYTATEQAMLQNVYDKMNALLDALQSYGLV